jgi:aminocarboxymuconate-semialdehyde decarboxylase
MIAFYPSTRRTSRRAFLAELAGGAAGLVLHGAPAAGAARREVRVGGRRVKVIDGHAHCAIPEAAPPGAGANGLVMSPERLAQLDADGIDVQVLSINPFWYATDRDAVRRLIDLQNERLAALCAAHPDRFVALATVALQYPDLAADQLEHAVKALGMRGVAIGGSVAGEELSAPKFDPFWANAEALEALVFVHPQGFAEIRGRVQGNGFLGNVIGNPLETTVALSHLIFEGTLDRFPRLRICAAHGGGFLPSYAGRFDRGCLTFPANCTGKNQKPPSSYLKQLFFDSLVFTPEGLRHLVAECGANQIVLGTDYPYPWTSTAVDQVLDTPGLSDADKAAILGGTLARLLQISSVF